MKTAQQTNGPVPGAVERDFVRERICFLASIRTRRGQTIRLYNHSVLELLQRGPMINLLY
jgi:hypothetical protein